MKKRFLALITAVTLICSSLPMLILAEKTDVYATRGQIVDMLLGAADDYTEGLNKGMIVKGYEDGSIKEDQYITRAEAFVMISRAFGQLPQPVGNNARISPKDVQFDGVPQWAMTDVENLAKAGVILGSDDGLLHGDDNVTVEQVSTVIRRIWTLEGSNLKDDYYNTVNKKELDESTIGPGEYASGGFNDLQKKNDQRLGDIIQEIVKTTHPYGSKEQKIYDLYQNIMNMEARNKEGIAPLKPYLDAVNQVQTMEEMDEAQLKMISEICKGGLLGFGLSVDMKNSSQYTMYTAGISPAQNKEEYLDMDSKTMKAYRTYLEKMLVLGGETAQSAAEQVEAYLQFEKDLAANQMDRQDYANVDKAYHVYTMESIKQMFPAVNVGKLMKALGLTETENVIVTDEGLLKAYSKYVTKEHLDLLKTITKIGMLSSYSGMLSQEFMDISNEYQEAALGIQGTKTQEELASMYVQGWMSEYLGELYVAKYFPESAKQDVENMVQKFIEVYEERIQKLDWMTDATKKMAVKKLETMNYKIGYPDSWDSMMDNIEIKGAADGGSFFKNYIAVVKESQKRQAALQGQPVDKTKWQMSAYTVNAYYNATANEIVFPAGILQAPFYDVDAKPEENLGGIGMVIAHEITHAFDNNGAKFDEKGNAANWWTEEDYAAFQKLCDKVVAFYDGQEAAPGIYMNGSLTLSENIADIGGMSCALEVASQLTNPDYDAFFRNNAKIWSMTTSREYLEQLSKIDYHSANSLRSNRVIVNFDEFYKTYGVQAGDGMYVPEAERVKIW